MQTKQVIIFRKDLLKGENGIRKGKFGAQCAHASLCAFLSNLERKTSLPLSSERKLFQLKYEENAENGIYNNWINGIYTKVVLGVGNEEELMRVFHTFQDKKLFPNGLP